MPRCRVGPFVWVAVLSVRVAAGQAASHQEFQVNTVTTGYQNYPSVAAFDSGFVVVWDSTTQDGDGRGVFARRYDFNGVPGPVFQVNQYTTGWQWRAGVAAAPNGTFVVTWHSPVPGGGYGVFARRYDAFGPPSPEFAVHASTEHVVSSPAIAMDPVGRFVVVWSAPAPEGGHDVFGRAYDPSGFPYGSEFRVNAYTSGYQ